MDNRSNMEPAAQNINAGKRYAEFRFLFLVLQGIGCTLIILTFYWVFAHRGGLSWSSTPKVQFNWHPLLMTIGMIYLYGNCKKRMLILFLFHGIKCIMVYFLAILVYRGLRYARKRSLKLCHASIFGSIMILVLIASLAVFDSHNLVVPPIPNLYSLHSWVGLIAVTLFILQVNIIYSESIIDWVNHCLFYLVDLGRNNFYTISITLIVF